MQKDINIKILLKISDMFVDSEYCIIMLLMMVVVIVMYVKLNMLRNNEKDDKLPAVWYKYENRIDGTT